MADNNEVDPIEILSAFFLGAREGKKIVTDKDSMNALIKGFGKMQPVDFLMEANDRLIEVSHDNISHEDLIDITLGLGGMLRMYIDYKFEKKDEIIENLKKQIKA